MRPLERGPDPRGYARYDLAYGPLIGRIGRYCSYCEAPLKNGEVEHILPKDIYPTLALSWDNFLLGCKNCNTTKGVWPTPAEGGRAATFWPDTDNTALAYTYLKHLPPEVSTGLCPPEQQLAAALLTHTGLDRHPGHARWSAKDDRWELRMEAWDQAQEAKEDLVVEDTLIHRNRIATQAANKGSWSVWTAVFRDDPDMLRRLHSAFAGTALGCFDDTTGLPVRGRRGSL